MVWLGIAIGALALIIAIGVLILRRAHDDGEATDVDPLFTMGVALTGAGVVLATTIGSVMYAVMIVGLSVMAIGAHRTRHHRSS